MLHDPRHDKTPSLAGFALFVASRKPEERYNWNNCMDCAVGQYLKSLDIVPHSVEWGQEPINTMNTIARGPTDVHEPVNPELNTWGKLADRILAHQMAD